MALRPHQLVRAAAPTTVGTLYTAPAATVATYVVVKQVLIANTHATLDATVTLALAGASIFTGVIPAGSTQTFDLSQLLDPTQTITAVSSLGGSSVQVHVAGVAAEV